MILCFIEFGVKPGMDDLRNKLLTELFQELSTFEGFLGKETYEDCDKPGRKITASFWSDRDALARWMRNRPHIRSIGLGKREVFTYYKIRIAEVERETNWQASEQTPA